MTDHINSLLISLGRASEQGALALLLVGVLSRVFARRLPADVHCWLWRLGYARLLLGLVLSGAVLVPLLSPAPRDLPEMQSPAVSSAFQVPAIQPAAVTPNHSQTAAVQTVPRPGLSWQTYLALAYGLGLTICLSRLLLAARRTRRILRSAVPEAAEPNMALTAALAQRIGLRSVPPLARSAAVNSPVFVAGTVLLPADVQYPEAEIRMILAHELAHAKRRDLFWEWLGTLVQVAFFFHPFVVLARREERLAREAAADALAIQATAAHAADYGEMLLSLSLRQNRPCPRLAGTVGVIEGGSLLRRRLLALRDAAGRTSSLWNRRRVAAILVPLIALVFVPWKITHGQAPEPSGPAAAVGPAVLTGTIVSGEGKPVPNALIDVVYTDAKIQQVLLEQAFRTNDAGLLRGTLAPIGNYAVSYVRADGFSEVFPLDKSQAATPGTTASLGTVRLVPAEGVVSGRVLDSAGKPIVGAVAWVDGGKTIFSAAGTDAKGYFRIPNVVIGELLSLGLCRKGTVRDSGTVITEDKERMQISGIEAGPTEREIVWNPHT